MASCHWAARISSPGAARQIAFRIGIYAAMLVRARRLLRSCCEGSARRLQALDRAGMTNLAAAAAQRLSGKAFPRPVPPKDAA